MNAQDLEGGGRDMTSSLSIVTEENQKNASFNL